MPARARRPLPAPSGDSYTDIINLLDVIKPKVLADWYDYASPSERHLVDRVLAEQAAQGWRANPATMAHHLLPDGEYQLWDYAQLLGQRFADGVFGRDPRQVITIPSQYGKTTIYGRWGIIWALDYNPRLRIIYVTYDVDKAVKEGGETRDLAERYQDQLRFTLRADAKARGLWRTEQGGYAYFTAVGGQITGWPADVVIGDDLIKGWREAHSEATREATWNVFVSQMRLRIQKPRDPIMLAGTRWHEDDPLGRACDPKRADNVDRFHELRLPAIAEAPSKEYPNPDPLGRAPGQVLEPARFPPEEVHARAQLLGSYLAAALEQQRPSPEEGNDLKRAWFKVTHPSALPGACDQWATSWDMKLKDKEQGDYVVGLTLGRTGADFWLYAMLRGQWNQATTRAAIALAQVREPRAHIHYVENSGYGPEVIEQLRARAPHYVVDPDVAGALGMTELEAVAVAQIIRRGMTGLLPVPPRGDKRVRARAVSPIAEVGNMHIAADLADLDAFLNEMAVFPNGAHDDIVDAWSQGLSMLSRGGVNFERPADTRVQRPHAGAVRSPRIGFPWQPPQRG